MNKNIILLSFTAVLLSGCDSIKHTFGLDHYQADEYSMPTTPPLSMPPGYNELPQPALHAQPTGYTPAKKRAQTILGNPASSESKETEENFIKKVSAGQAADENIRDTVDGEAANEKGALEKLANLGKTASDNLSGHGINTAEAPASRQHPAQAR
ncbi:DUF3035 domain-containing protein [Candidatus Odyssella acanthamoebae]|uniref:DUF3035 domain-containing protein n=1 Tax=Candidatus Odyssella acanthamoebae TaxID=91604 RepID=A0A077AXW5_9PROT|nr:DUF3035 domain-containing protein [Candidatus Paracaedibacter acanthamoebae]AIK96468.1 hypothetical protein ID47_06490 [Candidatus Paracaedibacter acanthamoebae]